ncbi:MAG: terminase small subunit [Planctomycetota bacterium]
MTDLPPLNRRQRLFVDEYLRDLNALEAARRAGYSPRNRSIGSELLAMPSVRAAVDTALAARAKRLQLSADDVLVELAIIGRSDVRWFVVGDDGKLALAEGAPEHAWRAVQSVKTTDRITETGRVRTIEVRLWPKVAALDLVGKHLGTWKEPIKFEAVLPPVAEWTDEQCERIARGEDPARVFGKAGA